MVSYTDPTDGTPVQDTQPSASEGKQWVDTSQSPPELKIYDSATQAWLPADTKATVVSQTKPIPEVGKIWFEPAQNGANMYAASSDLWEFLKFLPAIPDSGLLHNYDWSDSATTTSTVPDLAGSADLTGSFTDLNASINGKQAGTFDGSDDTVNVDYNDVSEPYDIFAVMRFRSINDLDVAFDAEGGGTHQLFISGSSWEIFQGSTLSDGTGDTNAHLFTSGWGATDVLRIDESDEASGDVGTSDTTGLTVGSQDGGGNYTPLDVGQFMVYDADASGYDRSDVESYLVDKWGPF